MSTSNPPNFFATLHIVTQTEKLRPLRLYAHWLDGEWQKIAYPLITEGRYLTSQTVIQGWIKLHALFGTTLTLSDVQLTDSLAVLRLFADSGFREYLRYDNEFLCLVAHPTEGISNDQFARATRGIRRSLQPGWATSLPQIPVDLIKEFAESILTLDRLDTAHCFKDRSKGPGKIIVSRPEHKELLEGMLHGICHFTKKTGGPSETPSSAGKLYTDFIQDALNAGGLDGDEYGALESVWKNICIKWVPDESKRGMRTALVKAMEAEERNRMKWPAEWNTTWNTAVHAWNANVCDTVGAERSSIVELPGAVIPFRGKVSDVAGPFTRSRDLIRADLPKKFPFATFDPTVLSWPIVRTAVKKTRHLRTQFQRALASRNYDNIRDAGTDLVGALAQSLSQPHKTFVPEFLWLPLSVLSFFEPRLHAAEILDRMQSFVRTTYKMRKLLNTLHGVKDNIISGFMSSI